MRIELIDSLLNGFPLGVRKQLTISQVRKAGLLPALCSYLFFRSSSLSDDPRLDFRLLLRDAVDRSHAPDQRFAIDAHDPPIGKQAL